jgi:hypothetical protein
MQIKPLLPSAFRIVSVLAFSFFALQTHALSCCGGNFALPALITGDERLLVTTTASYDTPSAQVLDSGIWRGTPPEHLEILTLNGAYAISDRWQAGVTLPVIQDQKESESGAQSSRGLGDVGLGAAYELISDLNYDPSLPKMLVFTQLTVPSGHSVYDGTETTGTGIRGRGFYETGIGATLIKGFDRWDVLTILEIHKSYANSDARPGFGESLTVGGGCNLGDFRLGATIAWSYEDPIHTNAETVESPSLTRWATGTLSLSYLLTQEWATSFSYSDQTILGTPVNAVLNRSFIFSLQRRWLR